jgi:primosomal replication protein N''
MTTTLDKYRHCPACGSDRPESEWLCQNDIGGERCLWPLADQPVLIAPVDTGLVIAVPPAAAARVCANGHPMADDMEICFVCGADAVVAGPPTGPATGPSDAVAAPIDEDPESAVTIEIEGLSQLRQLRRAEGQPFTSFTARDATGRNVFVTLYDEDAEPDPQVYQTLRRLPRDHVPELLAVGRHDGRSYDVFELIGGGSLAEAGYPAATDPDLMRRLITELAGVLTSFEDAGLRHRDLNPRTILIRGRDPLDLVVAGFGSARLSDFDLESVAPLELTRYSAPEAIVGAVSAASDWWSAGMIVLEQTTAGQCFEGTNDQALRLHVVTRGIDIPPMADPRLRLLLRGLLARDPHSRWSGEQVRAWLRGEPVEAPDETRAIVGDGNGTEISLGGREYTRADQFALAAAEPSNWEEAQEMLLNGVVATWLSGAQIEGKIQARFRRAIGNENVVSDYRHALALMAMNPNLPLTLRGEIVTPAWLLAHPDHGYEIVTGEVGRQLEQFDQASWIVALASRAEAVRDRARLLEIELDESRLRVALLSTSRPNLEAEREVLRRVYPDTDHAGLASILERPRLSDEDLIILISAATTQFVALDTLVNGAVDLASRTGVDFEREPSIELFVRPRREIFALIDQRTANFARCGNSAVDEWVDTFRVERRMTLVRAAIVLGVPADQWLEPPRQQYVANLLSHFEKRVTSTVSRGPLARFTIGKTTPRLDLSEMGTALRPADSILNLLIGRTDTPVPLDPSAYAADENRQSRLRRLVSHAQTFRRDTGLDGRTMGFPFLLVREARSVASEPEARPRLAPVLLWPIILEFPVGSPSATISFDKEREEVRLNPALETMLPPNEFHRWKAARDELLSRGAIRYADVLDIFGSLAQPRSRTLERLPPRDLKVPVGTVQLLASAALFNAEFAGQAIAEDMRQMMRMPPIGTGLDAALRIGGELQVDDRPEAGRERDRFLVVAADPSQESAVFKSRSSPGLLVEGPPGTGKSQTIVNVVTDAIGRGETVLVVCQKQAALKVVQKRLDAEGMGDRLFLVVDVNKDRETIARTIREQRDLVRAVPEGRLAALLKQRDERTARIETLEAEIDATHAAHHREDNSSGLTYRDVLDQLIALEEDGPWIAASQLRQMFAELKPADLSVIEETCGPLAQLWLASRFEGSPLHALKQFAVDPSVAEALEEHLETFLVAETRRAATIQSTAASPEVEDVDAHRAWLDTSGQSLEQMPDGLRAYLSAWLDLFEAPGVASQGDPLIARIREVGAALAEVPADDHADELFAPLLQLDDKELGRTLDDARKALSAAGFLGSLNFRRHARHGRLKRFLEANNLLADKAGKARLHGALELETALRPLRQDMTEICQALQVKLPAEATFATLVRYQQALGTTLEAVRPLALAVRASPWQAETIAATRVGTVGAFAEVRERMLGAFLRSDARRASRSALAALEAWFEADWLREAEETVNGRSSAAGLVAKIRDAAPGLSAFQRFRLRATALQPEVLRIFAMLREWQGKFDKVSQADLDPMVRRTIRREALLAWKGRIEVTQPQLLVEAGEILQKVTSLAALDREVLVLNRQILRLDIDPNRLGTTVAWDDLTRLRGPRAKRLREILDQGRDLGLMRMRPIWLMNPDVASRVLPLKAGLFDVVIYDEASQMQVEFAVPTLFRAKRVLIAGDEKQMPPTSFFSSSHADDEDEESSDEAFDDAITEAERVAQEETWNRREVKDCPDLLQLGRGVLPSTTLQIHYRSKYRELIDYSNSAFYGGGLSVPASHPADEIRRVRPIEVVRANGIYEAQTNAIEAERVVDVVARLWAQPTPPSIGVVTFNRKQADLVEEAFDRRAAADDEFLRAYRRERDRTQGGEDMGFFVKNVENVQGDERDVIVFSTTFGRDKHGAFRRVFGVLGQAGGERRLNVAVTRAREKVVLVTSMPLGDISDWLSTGQASKPRDYLQAYVDYAERLSSGDIDSAAASARRLGMRSVAARRDPFEQSLGGFVQSVGKFIATLGVDAEVSRVGDAFQLDFAIKDPRTGLFGIGIECDAPRHQLLSKARAREIWRPSVLKRELKALHRVTSHGWYHEPQEERDRLRSAIAAALT